MKPNLRLLAASTGMGAILDIKPVFKAIQKTKYDKGQSIWKVWGWRHLVGAYPPSGYRTRPYHQAKFSSSADDEAERDKAPCRQSGTDIGDVERQERFLHVAALHIWKPRLQVDDDDPCSERGASTGELEGQECVLHICCFHIETPLVACLRG